MPAGVWVQAWLSTHPGDLPDLAHNHSQITKLFSASCKQHEKPTLQRGNRTFPISTGPPTTTSIYNQSGVIRNNNREAPCCRI